MKRKEKAERIHKMLEDMYPEIPVPLDHETPFQLLIAVLMSAQTTDLKVNQVTPELFRQGPTPERMAALEGGIAALATSSGSLFCGLITPVAATITPIIITVIRSILKF